MDSSVEANALIKAPIDGVTGIWRVVSPIGYVEPAIWLLAKTVFEDDKLPEISSRTLSRSPLVVRARYVRELSDLLEAGDAIPVTVCVDGPHRLAYDDLSPAAQEKAALRQAIMSAFLDPEQLRAGLTLDQDFGLMVRSAVKEAPKTASVQRSTVYEHLKRLINLGFCASSLFPRSANQGAPGQERPYGEDTGRRRPGRKSVKEQVEGTPSQTQCISPALRPQILGILESEISRGKSFATAYQSVLAQCYVISKEFKDGRWHVELPPHGEYPNLKQVRHLFDRHVNKIDRLIKRTTKSHFVKNARGLKGTGRDHVRGPGWEFQIDSTVADTHLRSAINRAHFVGRPVVYFVYDAYSTAIVGFYVCLNPPSWRSAACAVFVSCAGTEVVSSLIGTDLNLGLSPEPRGFGRLLSDNGEYKSVGGAEALHALGSGFSYNAGGRPDLRPGGERFNSTTNMKFREFDPGSFNRRAKEIERQANPELSQMTVHEYISFLSVLVRNHNLTADRSKIAPAEVDQAGFDLTPAGLWAYGHASGNGYSRKLELETLVRNLLPRESLMVRRNGIHLAKLRYRSDDEQLMQNAEARAYGVQQRPGYFMPFALSSIYIDAGSDGVSRLELAPGQLVGNYASHFDYLDAVSSRAQGAAGREDKATRDSANAHQNKEALTKAAKSRTAKADESQESRPKISDARETERQENDPSRRLDSQQQHTNDNVIPISSRRSKAGRHEDLLAQVIGGDVNGK